jgi:hypothetical protein
MQWQELTESLGHRFKPRQGPHKVAYGESRGKKEKWKYFSSPVRGDIMTKGREEF